MIRGHSRRSFIKRVSASAAAAPFIWSGRASGATAPGSRLTAASIGVGRMGRADLGNILGFDDVQVVAVCDVDSKRAKAAKHLVESRYADRVASGIYRGCDVYEDYHDVLARDDIDLVLICTPDFQHALPAIDAAKAGKDIFLEKPLTFTVQEGRVLSDTVTRYSRILQVGSMQRSAANFRFGCELVRNGRIGDLQRVEVGCGIDKTMGFAPVMPVPKNLNYEMWQGGAPWRPYTETRVHPQHGYSRPGWLRCRDYTIGMMTGWGSHHMDIAQWGIGVEESGPREIEGWAEYPDGQWNVHGRWNVRYTYENGVEVFFGDNKRYAQGVKFIGSKGWVHVKRWTIKTEPDSLVHSVIGPSELHLYKSNNHMGNFLECVKSRRQPVAPVEIGHRSCTACILGDIAARLQRPLRWDPVTERFVNDAVADRMLGRPPRGGWGV